MHFDLFRAYRDLTEKDFAARAKLRLATVQAWRRDEDLPDVGTLRDVASRFNVSVADLLGQSQDLEAPSLVPALGLALQPEGLTPDESLRHWQVNRHRHWGHIGLRPPRHEAVAWFAVSAEEAAIFAAQLAVVTHATIVTGTTRNNTFLVFSPKRLKEVILLPQSAVRPYDFNRNWDGDGLPFELYRALRRWATSEGVSLDGETPAMQARLKRVLGRSKMTLPIEVLARTSTTSVWYVDGPYMNLIVEPASARYAAKSVPLGSLALILTDAGDHTEYVVPLERVSFIEMPLIDILKPERGA